MNAFIFRFHPRGGSFMESLLDRGLDPWSVDLRGQTSAKARPGHSGDYGLADYAFTDLPAAFDFIAEHTGFPRVHAIGCSLGGALLYAYGGSISSHRIDRLVTIGTPLRWVNRPWIVGMFAQLSAFAGFVRVRGTRNLARVGLPIVSKMAPKALAVYLNPALTFTGGAHELVRTVEDPHPNINRELAEWIAATDLDLGGVNVTEALAQFDRPLLVIAGSADQICPPAAALAAIDASGGPTSALMVGSEFERFAHADLFIADNAPAKVFGPVARFLTEDT